jgi:hypothetical protein
MTIMKSIPIILGLNMILFCNSKLESKDPPQQQKQKILYYGRTGAIYTDFFPHNSLRENTTFERAERSSYFTDSTEEFKEAYIKFKSIFQANDTLCRWAGPCAGMFRESGVSTPTGLCIIRENRIFAVIKTGTIVSPE